MALYLWIILGLIIYTVIGCWFFVKYTCMGMIGFQGKNTNAIAAGFTAMALIMTWPLYLVVVILSRIQNKIQSKAEKSLNKVNAQIFEYFTCIGKGGLYRLLGTATPIKYLTPEHVFVGAAIGAGTSKKDEPKIIYQNNKGEVHYLISPSGKSIFGHAPLAVYRSTSDDQMYYREVSDFEKRMEISALEAKA